MPRRRSPRALASLLALVVGLALAACSGPSSGPSSDPSSGLDREMVSEPDGWVVVMFEGREERFDVALMDALLETEMAADAALAEANAGWIDGNDVGNHGYELYFFGDDAREMWSILEPVFAEAPVAWTRVELRDSLDDPSPQVLTQG